MKLLKIIILSLIILTGGTACDKESTQLEITGIIQLQGITTYQYGSHIIQSEKLYALKSSTVNLDNYINQTVTIVGEKVDSYPVDGGPDYLNVTEVK